jgi:hypothetical protein
VSLSPEQIKNLIDLVATAKDDQLDCDGCLEHIAEFAEANLAGLSLSAALKSVQVHLESCGCCRDEFEALLAALTTLDKNAQAHP